MSLVSRLSRTLRLGAVALLSGILVACGGGGGTTPVTGVQQPRPLSQDFTVRKAVNYSPFRTSQNESQRDAEVITKAMIKQDLDLMMAAGFRLIRLFDSSEKVARQTLEVIRDNQINMKMQLGAYVLSGNDAESRAEIARCVALANEFKDIVLAVSVGNETMVSWAFNRIDPSLMGGYLKTVREQITQPVTTDDNYAFWALAPSVITDQIDFASLHTYAELDTVFDPTRWDWKLLNVPAERRAVAMMDAAIAETKRQYQEARDALDSKGLKNIPITIGETGWNAVDVGKLAFRAHPVNQKMYLDRLMAWAAEGRAGNGPKAVFYFEAFDEPWKQGDDKWGLFNVNRQARYAIQALNAPSSTWVWEPGTYTDADAVYFKAPVVNAAVTASQYTLYANANLGSAEMRPTGLNWDAFDGNTVFAPEVSGTYAPGDAANAIQINPTPASWGWGFLNQSQTGVTENLSGYEASGAVNFWVSTTYPGKIEIGVSTDTQDRVAQEAYLQIEPGMYGYCNTGAWCKVSIPLSAFKAVNSQLDFSLVLSRFIIADRYAQTGKAAGSNVRTPLVIDAVNWTKTK